MDYARQKDGWLKGLDIKALPAGRVAIVGDGFPGNVKADVAVSPVFLRNRSCH